MLLQLNQCSDLIEIWRGDIVILEEEHTLFFTAITDRQNVNL